MTLKHMQSATGYRIMARNWRRVYSRQEVYEAMKKKLNLERFDRDALDDEDRRKYDELVEFLRGLESPT